MKIKGIFVLAFLISGICVTAQKESQMPVVHDPVMAKQGDTYYLFSTADYVNIFSSKDLKNWKMEKPVFSKTPEWVPKTIPQFAGNIWAPDIYHKDGVYYMYYSVSSFGKNTSCIGLATNTTLNPKDKDYKWVDHGKVIQSVPGRDMWNAIDANIIQDEDGTFWMSFGSFWGGLKLVKMSEDLKSIAQPEEWYTIASRDRALGIPDENAGNAAIEAPFIFKKDNYYYLFVSFDFCCRGANSTYKVMVGRSESVTGPYVDRDGKRMLNGGGSLVVQGNKNWPGVGHNSTYSFDGVDYMVFHGYDMSDGGRPKLLIRKIQWDDKGWPIVVLDGI